MRKRHPTPAPRLDAHDAALIKGMIARGDRQSDIGIYFGVNLGRIGEIVLGQKFGDIPPAPLKTLPRPGPYIRGHALEIATAACQLAGEDMVLRLLVDLMEAVTPDPSEVKIRLEAAA